MRTTRLLLLLANISKASAPSSFSKPTDKWSRSQVELKAVGYQEVVELPRQALDLSGVAPHDGGGASRRGI